MSDRSAIAITKFLGQSASAGGPLALLGLDPTQLHDVSVVAALEQRLSQVWEHAEGDSPEADEVRLALHAAAAQLLDPVMRRRALAAAVINAAQPAQQQSHPQQHTSSTQPIPTAQPLPNQQQPTPHPSPTNMAMLERDAMLTLARHGGWSPQALREVAMMGAVRGLGPDDVATALHKLSRGGGKRKSAPTPTQTPSSPAQAHQQHQQSKPQNPLLAYRQSTAHHPQPQTQPTPASTAHRPAQRSTQDVTPNSTKAPSSGPISDIAIFAAIALTLLIGAAAAIVAFTSGNTTPAPAPAPQTQAATTQPATQPTTQSLPQTTTQTPAPPDSQREADNQQSPSAEPTTARRNQQATPDPRPEQAPPDAVIADLRAAVSSLADKPADAIERFETAWTQLASWWPDYDTGQRRAATGAVVEIVIVASTWDDVLDRIIDIIAQPSTPLSTGRYNNAGQPRPQETAHNPPPLDARLSPNAAWSAATLARLSGERQLSAAIARRLDRLVLDRFGAWPPGLDRGIEPALTASLRRIPQAILNPATTPTTTSPNRTAAAWINAVNSLDQQTPTTNQQQTSTTQQSTDTQATILLIDGLDTLLRQPPNTATSAELRDFLQDVANNINWHTSTTAQRRLIDWLRDPAIDPSGLQAITTSIVAGPAQPSASPTTSSTLIAGQSMILPPNANPAERGMLAIEYAKAWGLADAARATEAESAWRAAVSAAFQSAHEAQYPEQILAAAVTMSLLSESAQHLWRGEPEAAARLAQSAAARSAAAIAPQTTNQTHDLASAHSDPSWAIRYIEAGRNRTVLLALLEELERRSNDSLSILEAEVLAESAAFGAPLDVRAKAQDVTAYLARQPAIVNAVLETLPRAPRTRTFGIMVERVAASRLPPVTDDRWPVEARRALVERLLMMRAGEGQAAAIDRLVATLAHSYDARRNTTTSQAATPASTSSSNTNPASQTTTTTNTGTSGGGGGVGGDAEASALRLAVWTNELIERYRADARRHQPNPRAPVPMREIERRLAGRRLLAQGPIQSFAADQSALAELMAYIVSAEKPGRADRILRITRDAEHARQTATHVFNQILAGERAMLELWLIRLGELP